jgi:hypothetical protein
MENFFSLLYLDLLDEKQMMKCARSKRVSNATFHKLCDFVAFYNLHIRFNRENKLKTYSIIKFLIKSKFICDLFEDHFMILILILFHAPLWVRRVEDLKIGSYNSGKLIRQLITFLFCKYPIPPFAYQIWTGYNKNNQVRNGMLFEGGDKNDGSYNSKEFMWFFWLANGNSIKKIPHFPININGKLGSFMYSAPDNYNFYQAAMFAHLKNLGLENRHMDVVLNSNMRNDLSRFEFWKELIQIFIDEPMMDFGHYFPLVVDYINHQKFSPEANQPNYNIKKRHIANIVRDAEHWHKALFADRRKGVSIVDLKWSYHPFIKPHCENISKRNSDGNKTNVKYEIKELNTSVLLYNEGKTLGHCVYSYSHSCAGGRSSIWSMMKNSEKLITIEVDNRTNKIVQVRGLRNRGADEFEKSIITRWGSANNLEYTCRR